MKLAFVSPRMGEEVVGGAEQLCLRTAARLQQAGIDVDLYSTTIGDFQDAREAYPRGESQVSGVRLVRFPADPADTRIFGERSGEIARWGSLSQDAEEQWLRNNLNSTPLLDHLAQRIDQYDNVVFFQYLRGLSHRGIERFKKRAVLCPTLHDEPFARMSIMGRLMNGAGGLVFLSEPEKLLATRLYGLSGVPRTVAGLGFTLPAAPEGAFALCSGPYLLYTGRIESSKGISRLVEFFLAYKSSHPTALKLVLCGDVQFPVPPDKSLLVLGRLGDDDLQTAYASALAAVQPSDMESFSISIFESWRHGRPVLVSRNCDVTRTFCERSNGGLYFGSYAEFEACLDLLLGNPDLANRIGQQGREFVLREYDWETVLDTWLDFLGSREFHTRATRRRLILLNTSLLPHDAVANNMVNKARTVCDAGMGTQLLLESNAFPPPDLEPNVCTLLDVGRTEFNKLMWEGDCYWIDYSVYYPLLQLVPELKARGKLVFFDYHGITPPDMWDDEENLDGLEKAIANMPSLMAGQRIVCHSSYCRTELLAYGVKPSTVDVIPYAIPVEDFFPTDKDRTLMEAYRLEESDFVILYVGRMAGNKRIGTLARAFGIASRGCHNLRLMLVGDTSLAPYQRQVEKAKVIATEYGVQDRVIFTGVVPDLRRYFNLADIFVTSSMHEGFCVPVIEAMSCAKPVIATRCTALPETVGDAGLLFEPDNPEELAEDILRLRENRALYDRLASAGIDRARGFDLAHYSRSIRRLLNGIFGD